MYPDPERGGVEEVKAWLYDQRAAVAAPAAHAR
jgi:hypothetical protein